ncbi:hypothetical protein, partial [Klebsiella pneumoniae]|uniref:hypothetical protein n=1 Tax=Klebsiella pneumoniae TaxID=573 RepID=UPI00272F689A
GCWNLCCAFLNGTPVGGLPSRLRRSVSIYCTGFLLEVAVLTCKSPSQGISYDLGRLFLPHFATV